MNKTTLAAALILLSGCDSHDEDDHDHGHGHETHDEGSQEASGHHEGHEGEHEGDHAVPATDTLEAALGDATVRLTPSTDSLRLTLSDAAGAALTPEGEARVVLTPTGGEEQRIVLKADGDAWSGPATAAGASGYVAVISLQRDGQTRTARIAWGDAPSAPEMALEVPHEDNSASDGDHAHGHGHDH